MSLINPLGELSHYTKFLTLYESKKHLPLFDWLEFVEIFKPGKQGIVGLLKTKEKDADGETYYCVFKMSQQIDYLTFQESSVMKSLNELAPYCPHFCKSYGTIECKRNPVKSDSKENPFKAKGDVKYMIKEEVLLSEYISNSNKFYSYIRSADKINEDVLYSIIKQVLLGISFAQKKRFSHYDLHSLNIMVKKCNKDVVFVYVLDEENQICVPTLGHYPIIIDCGFSYIDQLDDGPLWTTLAHTSSGFMSDRFDPVADPKLFLVTVSDEIKCIRQTKKADILRRVVKNMFRSLRIDWESGWDEINDKCAPDYVCEIVEDYSEKSTIFSDYQGMCIDLLNSLIVLPVDKSSNTSKSKKSFKIFLKEWVKIENEISNPYYNLYILKGVCDAARFVRSAYMDVATMHQSVLTFREMINARIAEVAKFCNPKEINYEKMLCSLYVFSSCMEDIYYTDIKASMKEKQKDYNKMPIKSIEQIYAAIDSNIPTPYTYNEKTTIFLMNGVKKETKLFTLSNEEVNKINSTHSFCRGSFLYDLYKEKK